MDETTKEDITIALIAGLTAGITVAVVTFTVRKFTPATRAKVK